MSDLPSKIITADDWAVIESSPRYQALPPAKRIETINRFVVAMAKSLPDAWAEDEEGVAEFNRRAERWRAGKIEQELPTVLESLPERLANAWDMGVVGDAFDQARKYGEAARRSKVREELRARAQRDDDEGLVARMELQRQGAATPSASFYETGSEGEFDDTLPSMELESKMREQIRRGLQARERMAGRLPTRGQFRAQSLAGGSDTDLGDFVASSGPREMAGLAGSGAIESSIVSASGMAMGILGGMLGGVPGAVGAGSVGGFQMEAKARFADYLVGDAPDEEFVARRLLNPDVVSTIDEQVTKEAATLTAVEGGLSVASGGLADKLLPQGSGMARKIAVGAAVESPLNAFGAGAGEAGAQIVAGRDLTKDGEAQFEVLMEALGEVGTDAPISTGKAIMDLLRPIKVSPRPKSSGATQVPPIRPPSPPVGPGLPQPGGPPAAPRSPQPYRQPAPMLPVQAPNMETSQSAEAIQQQALGLLAGGGFGDQERIQDPKDLRRGDILFLGTAAADDLNIPEVSSYLPVTLESISADGMIFGRDGLTKERVVMPPGFISKHKPMRARKGKRPLAAPAASTTKEPTNEAPQQSEDKQVSQQQEIPTPAQSEKVERFQAPSGRKYEIRPTGEVIQLPPDARIDVSPRPVIEAEVVAPDARDSKIDQARDALMRMQGATSDNQRAGYEQQLRDLGATEIGGKPGESMPFDSRTQVSSEPIFPGDPVTVESSGWSIDDDRGGLILDKAKVRFAPPVSQPADLVGAGDSGSRSNPVTPSKRERRIAATVEAISGIVNSVDMGGGTGTSPQQILDAKSASAPAPASPLIAEALEEAALPGEPRNLDDAFRAIEGMADPEFRSDAYSDLFSVLARYHMDSPEVRGDIEAAMGRIPGARQIGEVGQVAPGNPMEHRVASGGKVPSSQPVRVVTPGFARGADVFPAVVEPVVQLPAAPADFDQEAEVRFWESRINLSQRAMGLLKRFKKAGSLVRLSNFLASYQNPDQKGDLEREILRSIGETPESIDTEAYGRLKGVIRGGNPGQRRGAAHAERSLTLAMEDDRADLQRVSRNNQEAPIAPVAAPESVQPTQSVEASSAKRSGQDLARALAILPEEARVEAINALGESEKASLREFLGMKGKHAKALSRAIGGEEAGKRIRKRGKTGLEPIGVALPESDPARAKIAAAATGTPHLILYPDEQGGARTGRLVGVDAAGRATPIEVFERSSAGSKKTIWRQLKDNQSPDLILSSDKENGKLYDVYLVDEEGDVYRAKRFVDRVEINIFPDPDHAISVIRSRWGADADRILAPLTRLRGGSYHQLLGRLLYSVGLAPQSVALEKAIAKSGAAASYVETKADERGRDERASGVETEFLENLSGQQEMAGGRVVDPLASAARSIIQDVTPATRKKVQAILDTIPDEVIQEDVFMAAVGIRRGLLAQEYSDEIPDSPYERPAFDGGSRAMAAADIEDYAMKQHGIPAANVADALAIAELLVNDTGIDAELLSGRDSDRIGEDRAPATAKFLGARSRLAPGTRDLMPMIRQMSAGVLPGKRKRLNSAVEVVRLMAQLKVLEDMRAEQDSDMGVTFRGYVTSGPNRFEIKGNVIQDGSSWAIEISDMYATGDRAVAGGSAGVDTLARFASLGAAANISRIETWASSYSGDTGYFAWAVLGFEPAQPAKIRPSDMEAIEQFLGGPFDLMVLTSTKEGRELWKRTGEGYKGVFDLAPGSRSLKRLNSALARYDGQKTKLGRSNNSIPGGGAGRRGARTWTGGAYDIGRLAAHIRGNRGGDQGGQRGGGSAPDSTAADLDRERAQLMDAVTRGLVPVLPAERITFERARDEGRSGAEHWVIVDPDDDGRVLKIPYNGLTSRRTFGLMNGYLERIAIFNSLLGTNLRLEGVVPTPSGGYAFVVGQDRFNPTKSVLKNLNSGVALNKALESSGFEFVRGRWRHKTWPVHLADFANNYAIQDDGSVMIFDVLPVLESDEIGIVESIVGAGSEFYSFAGPGARISDRAALAYGTATALERAEISPQRIRQITGWHRGLDGKWRYELSDHNAILRVDGPVGDLIGDGVPLAALLHHPALFAAYPAARMIPVMPDPDTMVGAAYLPGQRTILMGELLEGRDALRALLHEVQHWIQDVEGFAGGTSPGRDGILNYAVNPGEREARDVERRIELTPEQRRDVATDTLAEIDGFLPVRAPEIARSVSPDDSIGSAADLLLAMESDGILSDQGPESALIRRAMQNPGMMEQLDDVEVFIGGNYAYGVSLDGTPYIRIVIEDGQFAPHSLRHEVVHAILAPLLEGNPAYQAEVESVRQRAIAALPAKAARAFESWLAGKTKAQIGAAWNREMAAADLAGKAGAAAIADVIGGGNRAAVREALEQFADEVDLDEAGLEDVMYALLMDHELVAQAFSRRSVARFLSAAESRGQSLWERLMSAVRKLFAKVFGGPGETLFDRLRAASEAAMASGDGRQAGIEALAQGGSSRRRVELYAPARRAASSSKSYMPKTPKVRARRKQQLKFIQRVAATIPIQSRIYNSGDTYVRTQINKTVREILAFDVDNATDEQIAYLTPSAMEYLRTAEEHHLSALARRMIVLRKEADAMALNLSFGDIGKLRRGFGARDMSDLTNLRSLSKSLETMLLSRRARNEIGKLLLDDWLEAGRESAVREILDYEEFRDRAGTDTGVIGRSGELRITADQQTDLLIVAAHAQAPRMVNGVAVSEDTRRDYIIRTIEQDIRAYQEAERSLREEALAEDGMRRDVAIAQANAHSAVAARMAHVRSLLDPQTQSSSEMIAIIEGLLVDHPNIMEFLRRMREYFKLRAPAIEYHMSYVHGLPFVEFDNYIPRPNKRKNVPTEEGEGVSAPDGFAASSMYVPSPIRRRGGSLFMRFGYDPYGRILNPDPFAAMDDSAKRVADDLHTFEARNIAFELLRRPAIQGDPEGQAGPAVMGAGSHGLAQANTAELQKLLRDQQAAYIGEDNDGTGSVWGLIHVVTGALTLRALASPKQFFQSAGAYADFLLQATGEPDSVMDRVRILAEEGVYTAPVAVGGEVQTAGRRRFMERRGGRLAERLGTSSRTEAIQILDAAGISGTSTYANAVRVGKKVLAVLGQWAPIGVQDRVVAAQLYLAEVRLELRRRRLPYDDASVDWDWLASDDPEAVSIVREARRKLESNINVSDLKEKATLWRRGGATTWVVRQLLFQLASHRVHQIARVRDAVSALVYRRSHLSPEDRADAVAQVAGAVGQSVTWTGIGIMWSWLLLGVIGRFIAGRGGDDEEDREKRYKVATRKLQQRTGIDIDPSTGSTDFSGSWRALGEEAAREILGYSLPIIGTAGPSQGATYAALDAATRAMWKKGYDGIKAEAKERAGDKSLSAEDRAFWQDRYDDLVNMGMFEMSRGGGGATEWMVGSELARTADDLSKASQTGNFELAIGSILGPALEVGTLARLKAEMDRLSKE